MSLRSTFLTTWLLGLGLLVAPRATSGQVPASDSTAPAASDSQPPLTASDTTTAATAPGDSILSAACSGPAEGATVARDLLVVVFAPEAGAGERAAAAKIVEGTLLGPVTSGEPGAYYLRVPSGGGGEEYRLRAAADQLILLDMVRQVGSRACPPIPPPDQSRQNAP